MAEPPKAYLTVVDNNEQPIGDRLPVHFNPGSLSLSYRISASPSTHTAGTAAINEANRLHRTSTSSTLTLELLFDTTTTGNDVRGTTCRIIDDMIAPLTKNKTNQNELVPWVKFVWGTFGYTGIILSMDETLDLFSTDGRPLRSTVRLSMSEVKQPKPKAGEASAGAGLAAGVGFSAGIGASASAGIGLSASASLGLSASVGTSPLTLAQAGDTLQSLTARAGASVSWKAVAAANNVDNPRLLPPGAVLNLNARADASIG